MIRSVGSAVVLSIGLLLCSSAFAHSSGDLLNFHGLGDLQPVGNYYNGAGLPLTPNYGVTFSSNFFGLRFVQRFAGFRIDSGRSAAGQQSIVGGLIVGVVSSSKDQTIREFNGKKHYNEWRFYYDTAFDQFYLMNAPAFRLSFQPASPLAMDNAGRELQQPSQSSAPGSASRAEYQ